MVEGFRCSNMQNQNILMCFRLHISVNSADRMRAARRRYASTRSLARAALGAVVLSMMLSGCGTFCGLAGGSGGGFGGGCSTGVRF
jgi:hypothetical protein